MLVLFDLLSSRTRTIIIPPSSMTNSSEPGIVLVPPTDAVEPSASSDLAAAAMMPYHNLVIRFPKVWESFIDVHWRRELFDGRAVSQFHLLCTAVNTRIERLFDANESHFRLAGLAAGTTFEISLRMKLAANHTEPAAWGAWATHRISTLAPVVIGVGTVCDTSICGRIAWTNDIPPSSLASGGSDASSALVLSPSAAVDGTKPLGVAPSLLASPVLADKFQVHVWLRGRVLGHDERLLEIPASARDFTVPNLPANSVFEVKVRAVSRDGDCTRYTPTVRFLTLDPVTVRVDDVAETEAMISWSRGDDIDGTTNADGRIEDFTLIVEQLPSQHELDLDAQAASVQVDVKTFAPDVRRYRLRTLHPGRAYLVKTRYRSVLGDASAWFVTRLTTLSPVAIPDVLLVGHNYVQVRWGREITPSQGAADTVAGVKEWEVRCSIGKHFTSTVLPGKEIETKIGNLMHGVDYSLDVRAITHSGIAGPWSLPIAVTTLHLLEPRVVFSGETWLAVSWDRQEKRYEDNITRYHVQVNGVANPYRVAKYFPATVTTFTFHNLKPGTKYHVAIQAFSDQRWGPWSDAVAAKTCTPCVPQLVRRGEEFVQVHWTCEYFDRCAVEDAQKRFQLRVSKEPTPLGQGPSLALMAHGSANNASVSSSTTSVADAAASTSATLETTVMESDKNVFRANRLGTYSRVLIAVRVFDVYLQTWCDWGPEVEFRTLPSVVLVTHVGETFSEVSWQSKPRMLCSVTDQALANGAVDLLAPEEAEHYVLRLSQWDSALRASGGDLREVAKFHFDKSHVTSFLISELECDVTYAVQLCYLDITEQWSVYSAPVFFHTKPPLRCSVLEVGEDACMISWGRWMAGSHLMRHDDAAKASSYRVAAFDVVADAKMIAQGKSPGPPLLHTTQGAMECRLTNLSSNTVYRVMVSSAPKGGAAWGSWSDPIYVMTLPPIVVTLDQVGQDYCQLKWTRAKRSSEVLQTMPGVEFIPCEPNVSGKPPVAPVPVKASLAAAKKAAAPPPHPSAATATVVDGGANDGDGVVAAKSVLAPPSGAPSDGEVLVYGQKRKADDAHLGSPIVVGRETDVLEYHVRLYASDVVASLAGQEVEVDEANARARNRQVYYEMKVNNSVHLLRIPGLTSNTEFDAEVRGMTLSKRWGSWSSPLKFRTTVPTQIHVSHIAPEGVTLSWGKKADGTYGSSPSTRPSSSPRGQTPPARITSAGLSSTASSSYAAAAATHDDDDADGRSDQSGHVVVADDLTYFPEDATMVQVDVSGIGDPLHMVHDCNFPQTSLVLTGLSMACAYAVKIRCLVDGEWSAWSDVIYIWLRHVAVTLVETSQSWLHVNWVNKPPPDARPKAQFLTLLGNSGAVSTAVGADAKSHIFRNLESNSLYTIHLLVVEQCPAHDPPNVKSQIVPPPPAAGTAGAAAVAPADKATGASVSMPIVSADLADFMEEGTSVRTRRNLELRVDRVGQNFVLLRWSLERDRGVQTNEAALQLNPLDVFELEVFSADNNDELPRYIRAMGTRSFVRQLKPDSTVRCRVRTVHPHTEAVGTWSNTASARLLPTICPVLGSSSMDKDVPGVGEDFLFVSWSTALASFSESELVGLSFEIRIVPLEGPNMHQAAIYETQEAEMHFEELTPDTMYEITVRTVISEHRTDADPITALAQLNSNSNNTIASSEGGGGAKGTGSDVLKGEWSSPLLATTLSPMAVALADITEVSATLHWRRRNCAQHEGWWKDGDNGGRADRKAEMASITSFHVRVSQQKSDAATWASFIDEQYSPAHDEFARCATMLRNLRPGGVYRVSVRASTGLLWGGWSQEVPFATHAPPSSVVKCVGENYALVEWTRLERQVVQAAVSASSTPDDLDTDDLEKQIATVGNVPASEDKKARRGTSAGPAVVFSADVMCWELSFRTVGSDPVTTTFTAASDTKYLAGSAMTQRLCVQGLTSNTPFTVCVRAVYREAVGTGPWSDRRYLCTLVPLKVDVGKVGETFVQVSWERRGQRTVAMNLRERFDETIKLLEAQYRDQSGAGGRGGTGQFVADDTPPSQDANPLVPPGHHSKSAESNSIPSSSSDMPAPLTLADMDGPGADAEGGHSESSSRKSSSNPTAEPAGKTPQSAQSSPPQEGLLSLKEKIRQAKELSVLQIHDADRSAVYPKGDDIKYELLVTKLTPSMNLPGVGSSTLGEGSVVPALPSDDAAGAIQGQIFVRKRLGKGESFFRLEGLTPQTQYRVIVRALFSTTVPVKGIPATATPVGIDTDDGDVPWGGWSTQVSFVTLKPISISTKCIGSEAFAVEWDTGLRGDSALSSQTAISKFQVRLCDRRTGAPVRADQLLDDSSLSGYVVTNLQPNQAYSITVRVCYEDDKWGVWSAAIHFTTVPKLLGKLTAPFDRSLEFVVWREVVAEPTAAAAAVPGGGSVATWQPQVTPHQLKINDAACEETFLIEHGTSTSLSIDALSIDTEYTLSVRDRIEQHWQAYRPILVTETLPFVPQRPTLLERKGPNVAIAWQHQRNIAERQYVYAIEMAVAEDVSRGRRSPLGPFHVIGYTVLQEHRMVLPIPIDACAFRVRVCKTNQTVDGTLAPVAVTAAQSTPGHPVSLTIDHPQVYVWSAYSAVAQFKSPSVPDHPTNIRVVNLTHNSALLLWNAPANKEEHGAILYRVYLNNSYGDRFTCIAEVQSDTRFQLRDLISNCHYRASVVAESAMGSSINNNTLHFSTHVAVQGEDVNVQGFSSPASSLMYGSGDSGTRESGTTKRSSTSLGRKRLQPMNSTLPPRTVLRTPAALIATLRRKRDASSPADDLGALLDDCGTTTVASHAQARAATAPLTGPTLRVNHSKDRSTPPVVSTAPPSRESNATDLPTAAAASVRGGALPPL